MDPAPNVVSLFVTDAELEAAWTAFDVAQRRVHELYRDGQATEAERRQAVTEATQAEAHFRAMFARHDGRARRAS